MSRSIINLLLIAVLLSVILPFGGMTVQYPALNSYMQNLKSANLELYQATAKHAAPESLCGVKADIQSCSPSSDVCSAVTLNLVQAIPFSTFDLFTVLFQSKQSQFYFKPYPFLSSAVVTPPPR